MGASNGAETPYAETEALLAILNNDETRLEEVLREMSDHELSALEVVADKLSDAAVSAFRRRRTPSLVGRWADSDGDEWWEFPGGRFRLAGRSPGGAMDGWTRAEVKEKFGELKSLPMP
jgi:hypothetical protein